MSLESYRPAEDEVVFEDYDYPGDFLVWKIWLSDTNVDIPTPTEPQIDYDAVESSDLTF